MKLSSIKVTINTQNQFTLLHLALVLPDSQRSDQSYRLFILWNYNKYERFRTDFSI